MKTPFPHHPHYPQALFFPIAKPSLPVLPQVQPAHPGQAFSAGQSPPPNSSSTGSARCSTSGRGSRLGHWSWTEKIPFTQHFWEQAPANKKMLLFVHV